MHSQVPVSDNNLAQSLQNYRELERDNTAMAVGNNAACRQYRRTYTLHTVGLVKPFLYSSIPPSHCDRDWGGAHSRWPLVGGEIARTAAESRCCIKLKHKYQPHAVEHQHPLNPPALHADDRWHTVARKPRSYSLTSPSPARTHPPLPLPPSLPQLVSHEVGSEVVDDGAEGEAVAEGGGHVGHLHVPVAARDVLAPLEQALETGVARHGSLSPTASTAGPTEIYRYFIRLATVGVVM